LALYSIEVITIITAATIGTILAVYLIVLRQNGWLGRGAKFYRCPNRRCNRIFQKPVELKDLSETPPRTYRACPHCGIDLEPLLTSGIKHKLRVKGAEVPQQRNSEVEIGDSTLNIETRKPEIAPRTENSSKKPVKLIETRKPETVTQNSKKPWKTNEATTTRPAAEFMEQRDLPLKTSQKSNVQEKTLGEGSTTEGESSNAPEGCAHFFGYLRCLPKGSAVPYGCYSCQRMVDCYMH
jgi:hypothetical protein